MVSIITFVIVMQPLLAPSFDVFRKETRGNMIKWDFNRRLHLKSLLAASDGTI